MNKKKLINPTCKLGTRNSYYILWSEKTTMNN